MINRDNFSIKKNKIGKVILDFNSYTGKDSYSDGDIENEILQIVKEGREKEVLMKDNRWPILYHLTPVRKNLLEWYYFNKEASLLEIGMGCGAITGLFTERVKSVESVEISPRRSEIAAYRHKNCSNLTIHVGNLNNMKFNNKFDYVTLIGVLEYAGSFTEGQNPYKKFLERCSEYLNRNGTLILAIENRLGIKYWAGANEDHIGKPFAGLTDYIGINGVKTFSKPALENLLYDSGFCNLDWYYPYPDYKLPFQIFADGLISSKMDFNDTVKSYDAERVMLFSEIDVLNSLKKDGLMDIFANSFLVFAKKRGCNR